MPPQIMMPFAFSITLSMSLILSLRGLGSHDSAVVSESHFEICFRHSSSSCCTQNRRRITVWSVSVVFLRGWERERDLRLFPDQARPTLCAGNCARRASMCKPRARCREHGQRTRSSPRRRWRRAASAGTSAPAPEACRPSRPDEARTQHCAAVHSKACEHRTCSSAKHLRRGQIIHSTRRTPNSPRAVLSPAARLAEGRELLLDEQAGDLPARHVRMHGCRIRTGTLLYTTARVVLR